MILIIQLLLSGGGIQGVAYEDYLGALTTFLACKQLLEAAVLVSPLNPKPVILNRWSTQSFVVNESLQRLRKGVRGSCAFQGVRAPLRVFRF